MTTSRLFWSRRRVTLKPSIAFPAGRLGSEPRHAHA